MTREKTETHSATSFQDDWLSVEEFKDWLKKTSNPQKAHCTVCNTTFDINSGGRTSVESSYRKKAWREIGKSQEEHDWPLFCQERS